jgi:FKBP-type peptidyl-prolyl cis-trans isomerase
MAIILGILNLTERGNQMKSACLIILASSILLAGCGKKEAPPPQSATQADVKAPAPDQPETSSGIPLVNGDTITTPSGLKYIDVVVGQGVAPAAGQAIKAHYTGWLTNGSKFDSSRDRGEPIEFPIGQGRVIKGWDEGLSSMKAGGRRMLIIPPDLAYGERGTPGGPIPPGATLVFDVELVSAANAPANP